MDDSKPKLTAEGCPPLVESEDVVPLSAKSGLTSDEVKAVREARDWLRQWSEGYGHTVASCNERADALSALLTRLNEQKGEA